MMKNVVVSHILRHQSAYFYYPSEHNVAVNHMTNMIFFKTNGISSKTVIENEFWVAEGPMGYILNKDYCIHHIESLAHEVRDYLAIKVFGSLSLYYEMLAGAPIWLSQAGLDSDIKVSRNDFERLVTNPDKFTCKFLYYYDVATIIGSLQNTSLEIKYLVGEFYKELNINAFMLQESPFQPTMMMFASGPIVTRLFSVIKNIFISLYSQLDYITKLCHEFQHMDTNYGSYKKLKSTNILYGNKKWLKLNNEAGTLLEESENIRMVMSLRNEIVHNGSFEDVSKVYQVFERGSMIEKFIFLPDFENGIMKSYKNRKRFFDEEVKLNEVLPGIVIEFWERLHHTFKCILDQQNQ